MGEMLPDRLVASSSSSSVSSHSLYSGQGVFLVLSLPHST
jgi:hypothetical protein